MVKLIAGHSVTSTVLFKNSTLSNSYRRSFSKFLTKIILSGIPFCVLRCWYFLKRSNISLIKNKNVVKISEPTTLEYALEIPPALVRAKKSVGGRGGVGVFKE